jgi:phosphoribosylformylglycinamidine (FGAM) synthase-like amidotransferase family enzyme
MKRPIRHGEGRVVFAGSTKAVMSSEPMGTDAIDARVCLTYTSDPNGSQYRTAGLTDRTGRILGLMPHPEAYIRASSAPDWTQTHGREPFAEGEGLQMFKNAFQFSREVGESR